MRISDELYDSVFGVSYNDTRVALDEEMIHLAREGDVVTEIVIGCEDRTTVSMTPDELLLLNQTVFGGFPCSSRLEKKLDSSAPPSPGNPIKRFLSTERMSRLRRGTGSLESPFN